MRLTDCLTSQEQQEKLLASLFDPIPYPHPTRREMKGTKESRKEFFDQRWVYLL
ncbi:MAG: hypothetical protein KJ623_01960 [Nanoarchaeota archaeon]|nr:hypothetical protein [Nanoarchaeota archaeon]MBU0963379.1 hypothetical protein [Nanoarchaeota archaeon]